MESGARRHSSERPKVDRRPPATLAHWFKKELKYLVARRHRRRQENPVENEEFHVLYMKWP